MRLYLRDTTHGEIPIMRAYYQTHCADKMPYEFHDLPFSFIVTLREYKSYSEFKEKYLWKS